MMGHYEELKEIASRCPEYGAIAEAQGFGISFLNNLKSLKSRRCDWCINWQEGDCHIYEKYHDIG